MLTYNHTYIHAGAIRMFGWRTNEKKELYLNCEDVQEKRKRAARGVWRRVRSSSYSRIEPPLDMARIWNEWVRRHICIHTLMCVHIYKKAWGGWGGWRERDCFFFRKLISLFFSRLFFGEEVCHHIFFISIRNIHTLTYIRIHTCTHIHKHTHIQASPMHTYIYATLLLSSVCSSHPSPHKGSVRSLHI